MQKKKNQNRNAARSNATPQEPYDSNTKGCEPPQLNTPAARIRLSAFSISIVLLAGSRDPTSTACYWYYPFAHVKQLEPRTYSESTFRVPADR